MARYRPKVLQVLQFGESPNSDSPDRWSTAYRGGHYRNSQNVWVPQETTGRIRMKKGDWEFDTLSGDPASGLYLRGSDNS